MEKLDLKQEDFKYVVFHQPNGKFPRKVAEMLGFSKDQYLPGILVDRVGNLYSGSSLLGLARVLDIAEPGDRILLTSFGSGAGSDSFSIIMDERILEKRKFTCKVDDILKNRKYVDQPLLRKHS